MKDAVAVKQSEGIGEWEARAALETLIRAKSIQKNPKMMAAVRKAAQARLDEMKVLQEMASAAKEK